MMQAWMNLLLYDHSSEIKSFNIVLYFKYSQCHLQFVHKCNLISLLRKNKSTCTCDLKFISKSFLVSIFLSFSINYTCKLQNDWRLTIKHFLPSRKKCKSDVWFYFKPDKKYKSCVK